MERPSQLSRFALNLSKKAFIVTEEDQISPNMTVNSRFVSITITVSNSIKKYTLLLFLQRPFAIYMV